MSVRRVSLLYSIPGCIIKGAVALRQLCNEKEMTQILEKGLSHFCFHGIINLQKKILKKAG